MSDSWNKDLSLPAAEQGQLVDEVWQQKLQTLQSVLWLPAEMIHRTDYKTLC